MSQTSHDGSAGVAIIGMAGRFPGANSIHEFWQNLVDGVESISHFDAAELELRSPQAGQHNYIMARGVLDGVEMFDAGFFNMTPREAELTDPQHRVLLECAWEALENAGYDPDRYAGAIGVYAGCSLNTYLLNNLCADRRVIEEMLAGHQMSSHPALLGNDKDFLATRVAYKLNLRGPCLAIQSACSTSLVAVVEACQSLLACRCDMALAGGVSISFPQKRGYLYQEGAMASSDGCCRPFDAAAQGTVFGAGVGVVVLRRLADALEARDHIIAVIKGTALNNDGSGKASYMAPSANGQAEVISLAHALAGVTADNISYVEAHGTGTPLGDPIEVAGLTQAFRASTDRQRFCALGSVKANIGHLEAAAGVTGLIKTALALKHRLIPPTLHFQKPNPDCELESSPFYVVSKLQEWKDGSTPRRAGVSSFGVGGTNAHVVLEEAPLAETSSVSRPVHLLVLSARTKTALEVTAKNLADHLTASSQTNLADVAYTLQTGRRAFEHRAILSCHDAAGAAEALVSFDAKRVFTGAPQRENPPIVFLFPGQGAQQANMGRQLYEAEPVFRKTVDDCCKLLQAHLGLDLRTVLYPAPTLPEPALAELSQTAITQPAMFLVEYALAQLWMSWGVQPKAMIGHSLGEYVAACLAGVFSLDDALALVAARGRMMQALPAGMMLAVRLPEAKLKPLLNQNISLAAVNAAAACVVSGPTEAIHTFQRILAQGSVGCVALQTSHAFHSAMMKPMLAPFIELVQRIKPQPPQIPFISNVTGTWISDAQAADPAYWAAHLRQPVRFADGLTELFKTERVFLEVGPGQTLSGLVRQHSARKATTPMIASLARATDESSELEAMLNALGQLWISGVCPAWEKLYSGEKPRRVALPAYPFERMRCWVEPPQAKLPSPAERISSAVPANNNGAGTERSAESIQGIADLAAPPGASQTRSRLRSLLGNLSGLNEAALGAKTTFTQLGFDSLFLTQASVAVEQDFGVRVAFRQLLEEFTTLDSLAEHIERNLSLATPAPAARNGNGHTRFDPPQLDLILRAPLTESQREIWFASQMSEAASCVYNESRLLHLRGPLQVGALGGALQKLVARHEALRATFAPGGDVQEIHRSVNLDMALADWSHFEATERTLRLDAAQLEEARQPFDLIGGPLIRARLIRLAEEHYVFVVTVHHLVCDGYSFGILLHDLGELYSAECRGRQSSLLFPRQFSHYVNLQTGREQSAALVADEKYWVDQFIGGAPVLELPTDQPRASICRFDGARAWHAIPQKLGDDLKRLSAEHGCTLFTTLFAAYTLLLWRLSRQKEIVVGVPLADRAFAGGDTLVGHCVNFLPLRASIEADRPFVTHLAAMRKVFLDADEHGRYAFGSLLQKLNPSRDPGRMPLLSATFNLERVPAEPTFLGLETELAGNPHSAASFDINFDVTDAREGFQLNCRYSASLFSAQTIQRWLAHFQTLLEGIVADPQRHVCDLPLLTESGRGRILLEWNQTHTDYPKDKCLHHIFEEEAAGTPDAVAIEFAEMRLTYRELNQRANRLAHRLLTLGVGPESIVAVCLERSSEMVIALLAILKAGAAYLPLAPSLPQERLALILAEARVLIVVTQKLLCPLLPGASDGVIGNLKPQISNLTIICLDSEKQEIERESPTNPAGKATATSLAYVSFTSGSTGKPKGVCVPHRAVMRLVKSTNYASFTANEVFLQLAPLAFDASTLEIWGPLLNGARLVIFPPHAPSLAELGEFIQGHGVTTLWLTAALFHQMIEEQSNSLRGLRQLLAGGDVLSVPHVKRALKELPACRLINGYGPTENTTFTCCHQITNASVEGRSIPIGRPIANTQVYVLNEDLQPVPIGIPGELYAGGDGLARGYLNQPELTAETFIPNPFSKDPSARLYKTGDLARWLPDGTIEFLGRRDEQVKIRGHRVELGEIETVLSRHPSVRECVVVARKDTSGDKLLTAYFVSPDSAQPTSEELREHLRRALPDYMIPSGFVSLQSLPLTVSGKVDRKALPRPGETEIEPHQPFIPANDNFEKRLAEIWQDVLGLSRIGASDDFFELGGHSLLALRLIAGVEIVFGKRIPVASVFHARTVAQMANLLREKDQPPRTKSVVQIQPLGRRVPLMLVHGAGGGMFWGYTALAHHLGTDQPVYAFKSRGMDGGQELATIEEIARDYVAELQAFQPRGPYCLGGYCFGGNVAYEMARELRAQGEKVALLALINCMPPNSSYDRIHFNVAFCAKFLKNLVYWGNYVLHLKRGRRREFLRWKFRAIRTKLLHLRRLSGGTPLDFDIEDFVDLTSQPEGRRSLWEAHVHALFAHQPKPYAGHITLLRTRGHSLLCSFDESFGWCDLAAGGVTVRIVSGAHETIMDEPQVRLLAEELRTCLDESNTAAEAADVLLAPALAIKQHDLSGGDRERTALQDYCHPLPGSLFPPDEQRETTSPEAAVRQTVWKGNPAFKKNGETCSPPDQQTMTQANQNGDQFKCVHHLFEDQAARTPTAAALVFETEQMTYAQLNRRADELAEHLQAFGIGPDVPVGICLERSLEMVIGVLAVLKAGGAYVPLDPAYPNERLKLMIQNSRSPLVLTQRELAERFESGIPPVRLELVEDLLYPTRHPHNGLRTRTKDEEPGAGALASPSPTRDLNPQTAILDRTSANLAYIIHTSGSTGAPKGVAIEHRNAVNFICWALRAFTRQELAGVLFSTSLCFDLSVFELFVTLSAGGRVIIARNALELPKLPARNDVTLINTVPSAATELLRLNAIPPSVQVINLAGEPLKTALVDRLYALGTIKKVHDLYGPSETTTYSTYALREAGAPATVGRPIANTQIHLLDANRQPVPSGEIGEIYIGGAGVARGYLHRPDLTAERFVPNPFSADTESRLYQTGDLAQWRPDGNLEFLGRIDHQIKIRGYRVEPGEVETALAQHPAVRECVVIAREDTPGEKRLVAYVVPGSDHAAASAGSAGLRRFLQTKLPDYMVPSAFVLLETLPLTANGKVDRKQLPVPDQSRPELTENFVAPSTPAEKMIAEVWLEVLGLDQIGIRDNFFELGGDSLLAVRVVSRLRQAFQVEVPVAALFEAPTITILAEGLAAQRWGKETPPEAPITRAPRDGNIPLSFSQQRLWFIDQLTPGTFAYNMPVAVRLEGALDAGVLRECLNQIVRRHEILRTTFAAAAGEPGQTISPNSSLQLPLLDLSGRPAAERESEARRITGTEAQRPFDLARGPLIRCTLLRLAARQHVLVVVTHHIVSDGWSLGVLLAELASLWEAKTTGGAPMVELQIQYADYAIWQRQSLHDQKLQEHAHYWKQALAGAPPSLKLPTDREGSPEIVPAAARCAVVLSKETAESLRNLNRRRGSTSFMTLLTALMVTLNRWTRQTDIVAGTVSAGRTRRETETLIGCFMNFLPIRAALSESDTGLEILSRVKAAVLDAHAHMECPFEKIVAAVNPERGFARNPIYNVGFQLENFPKTILTTPQLTGKLLAVETNAALLDLRFVANDGEPAIAMTCEYRIDLFEAQTIEHLLASFCGILKTLAQNPETPLAQFKLTPELDQQSRKNRTLPDQIAVTATFTAEPLAEPLEFWLRELELPAQIQFAPYNQVFQQLLEPASLLSRNTRGLNVVLVRMEDWAPALGNDGETVSDFAQRIERALGDLISALRSAAGRNTAQFLLCICPASGALVRDARQPVFFGRMQERIADELGSATNLHLIFPEQLAALYPVDEVYDSRGDQLGHVPYTQAFFTALATLIARKFNSQKRPAPKAIVLDCDQTLWAGVCGEDGPDGIALDPPRRALQQFMRAQLDAGRLLCLCSKNNPADVQAVFERRKEMPLKLEHFAATRTNWLPKSENLKALAKELNLGVESFVLVDDNPIECAEVLANCPGALALQLPESPKLIPPFLKHCWLFDQQAVTAEDKQRTDFYGQERQRAQVRTASLSLPEFLEKLDLKVRIAELTPKELPRAAQLTQRTNQFNCAPHPRTEAEIQELLSQFKTLVVSVSDRFGDYGLVGFVLCRFENDTLGVETFLLSCRALGRGVEHRILAHLGNLAKARGAACVDVHFVPSAKNKPALDFLESVGRPFRQPLNGGSVFRFPAQAAAGVASNAQKLAADSPPPTSPAKPAAQAHTRSPFARWRWIALEANQVNKIQALIEAKASVRKTSCFESAAPQTKTERELCRIWEELLRLERVGVRDNFFELGGHSLLAVRLFAQIENRLRVSLPLVAIFQSPTVGQLARAVDQQASPSPDSSLLPIHSEGGRPPLFLVHGAGGDVLWGYANLAQHTDPHQPIYGIQACGEEAFSTLEEMAAHYVEKVRVFQPAGPYHLGGYCFGGNVAQEMARQLEAKSENVTLLALLDCAPSNCGYETLDWRRPVLVFNFTRNLIRWMQDFVHLKPEQRRSLVRRKLRTLPRKLWRRISGRRSRENFDLEEFIDVTHVSERETRLWKNHLGLLVHHVSKRYGGHITLFRTRSHPLVCSFENDFGWGKLAATVTVKSIPGSHEGIFMEPHVRCLARQLEQSLCASHQKSQHETLAPGLV
jgi:amino acid adenylation domain-containing protein/FkbH-like protein